MNCDCMSGMMNGWWMMLVGAVLAIALVAALVSASVFLIRRSRPR